MSNQKWEVGPVKLVNGLDAVIHRFCEKRQQYIGELRDGSGSWFAREWNALGHYALGIGVGDTFNLVPPPKKTLRVRLWLNIYDKDSFVYQYGTRELADIEATSNRFACIEIDREVEEGEGLDPNVRSDAANVRSRNP